MDLATLLALFGGLACLYYGIQGTGAGVGVYIDVPSIYITIGGACCSTLFAIKLDEIKNAVGVAAHALINKPQDPVELIKTLVRFAEIARRDGILALEGALEGIKDEFLVRGIQMAVDGSDPELIYQTMSTELKYLGDRHADGKKFFDLLAKYAPAWGMIGTLVGLVALLLKLDDPAAIGPNMAIALITTLYGAVLSNWVCDPISYKLSARHGEEQMTKELIIQGVMSIQSGDNPKIVEQKLRIFLCPKDRMRLQKEREAAGAGASAAAKAGK